jgi:hypothetical protein
LPALGSGFTDLARTGQHERLLGYDLTHYAAAFDQLLYFSYFDESAAGFTRDAALSRACASCRSAEDGPTASTRSRCRRPSPRDAPVRRAARAAFTGVIPALIARGLYGIPFAVTYGYHYGEVARLSGSRWKPWLILLLERVALPRAAAVIVTSREMERRLAAHPRGRGSPISRTGWISSASPRRRAAGRAAVAAGAVRRAARGEKNVERLIDALALVRERRPARRRR